MSVHWTGKRISEWARRITAVAVVATALLAGLFTFAPKVCAWPQPPGGVGDYRTLPGSHVSLTKQSVELVTQFLGSEHWISSVLLRNLTELEKGQLWADMQGVADPACPTEVQEFAQGLELFPSKIKHWLISSENPYSSVHNADVSYYHLYRAKGPWNAVSRANYWYGEAMSAYRSGDYVNYANYLGRALHYVQDMTCPAHADDWVLHLPLLEGYEALFSKGIQPDEPDKPWTAGSSGADFAEEAHRRVEYYVQVYDIICALSTGALCPVGQAYLLTRTPVFLKDAIEVGAGMLIKFHEQAREAQQVTTATAPAPQQCPTISVDIPEHIIRPVPDPAAETGLTQKLMEHGFPAVSRKERPQAHADILIKGEAFAEAAGRVSGFQQAKARLEVKVIRASTGEILASEGLHAGGIDVNLDLAAKRAFQRAGEKMGERLAPILARKLNCGSPLDIPPSRKAIGVNNFESKVYIPNWDEGAGMKEMVEKALSRRRIEVAVPVAADVIVSGTISKYEVVYQEIDIPFLNLILRVGIAYMTVEPHAFDLETAEIVRGDEISDFASGFEILGFNFGFGPKAVAQKISDRIVDWVRGRFPVKYR